MPVRAIAALVTLGLVVLAAGLAWDAGLLSPRRPLVETPEAVAAGRAFVAARCTGCHREVPLHRRVAGWSPERAYEVLGALQDNPRASMPPFPGSEEERRQVALYLSALGAGRAQGP